MIQRYSIILWRKAENENKSFEDISKETYDVLNIFQEYPKELRPVFLVDKYKKNREEFEWNYDNFSKNLKEGVNKEGARIFGHLGYSISFYSSEDENESCSFEVNVGNKNEKFYNTIIINLPLNINLSDAVKAKEIVDLFKKICDIYMPFWGCVSTKILSRKYKGFYEEGLPTTVHWLNYWSDEIVKKLDIHKIIEIVKKNSGVLFDDNVLSIKETALDMNKDEDVEVQSNLHKQFFG